MQLLPPCSHTLLLLHQVRSDYDAAEELYNAAIGADPYHANSLYNYAVLLDSVKRDYDKVTVWGSHTRTLLVLTRSPLPCAPLTFRLRFCTSEPSTLTRCMLTHCTTTPCCWRMCAATTMAPRRTFGWR